MSELRMVVDQSDLPEREKQDALDTVDMIQDESNKKNPAGTE